MLEGNELEGKIGDYGQYTVDVQETGMVVLSVALKLDVIAELRKLAKKTDNSLDDKIIDMIEHLLAKKP